MGTPRRKKQIFRTGEVAPVTGIYRVVHAGHRLPHHGILLRGEKFPPCRTCLDAVTFMLLRAAGHMASDSDLEDVNEH